MTKLNRITTEQRAELIKTLRRIYAREGVISMEKRQQLAEKYNIAEAVVTYYVSKNRMKGQHRWTAEEREFIWLNFEQMGYKALAEKYNVSVLAVRQQVSNMRRVDDPVKLPWK